MSAQFGHVLCRVITKFFPVRTFENGGAWEDDMAVEGILFRLRGCATQCFSYIHTAKTEG